jgi:hypothetical protein
MLTLLVTSSSPFLSKMVPDTPVASTVSPSAASARAARNEPGPLSAVVVTEITAALAVTAAKKATTTTKLELRRIFIAKSP